MRNGVPSTTTRTSDAPVRPIVHDLAHRSVAARYSTSVEEVQRLIDATYRVLVRTGSVEPKVSDIVVEAGLSNQAFYRHFRSKDELLVAILDDGRRQLVSYLAHRMDGAAHPLGRIRRWIEGVLAQAVDPQAAARTRPFALSGDRLADAFPTEHRASIDALTDLLHTAVTDAVGCGHLPADTDTRRSADALYQLTMGRMHRHLVDRTSPSRRDIEHVVAFVLRGLGATGSGSGSGSGSGTGSGTGSGSGPSPRQGAPVGT